MFRHEVDAWTVGQLRKALQGISDDRPVTVYVAFAPGGGYADEQVVIRAGRAGRGNQDDLIGEHFAIGCDYASGTYEHPT